MRTIELKIRDNVSKEELNRLAFFFKKNIIGAFPDIEEICIKEYSEIEVDTEKALETEKKNLEKVLADNSIK